MSGSPLVRRQEGILFYLLVGVGAFNAADYLLTLLVLRMGYRELNPIMDLVVHTPYFPLIKLVLIPLMLCFVWWNRHRVGGRLLYYAGVVFLVYLALMIYFKLHLWMWVV